MIRRTIITLALVWTICFAGWGFACSKKTVDAFCLDLVSTLDSSEGAVINALPKVQKQYDQLQNWATEICTAIKIADNLKAKTLIAKFLPVFSSIANQLGANEKYLALADIAIRIILNHLPNSIGTSEAFSVEDQMIINYKNEKSWGCKYYPEKCK